MYGTSSAFQTAVRAETRQIATKLDIQTVEDTFSLTGADLMAGGITVTSACMSGSFELGAVISTDLAFNLNNLNDEWNDIVLDGATVFPQCGFVLDSGLPEYVPMGAFIIDEPGRPYSTVAVKASDRLILLDRPFADITITYPASLLTILQAMCTASNVPLSTSALTALNIDYVVAEKPTGDYSCRDILSEIALLAGGFARMNRLGELELVRLQKPNVNEAYSMPLGSRYDFRQEADEITITGLTYKDLAYGTGDYAIEIKEMALMPIPNPDVLSLVFNGIEGFTYTPFTANYSGNPAIDTGDAVLHITRDNKEVLTLITKHTYRHAGRSLMQAEGKSKAAISYQSANTRRLASVAAQITESTDLKLTAYQQASAQLADLIGMMLGTHRSEDVLEDGSIIYYFHDKPLRSESTVLWRFDGFTFASSIDGGLTWPTGLRADSNLIIQMIQAIGINAEWIKTGQIDTALILVGDQTLEQALGSISQQVEQLTGGGTNFIQNSNFGTYDAPSDYYWGFVTAQHVDSREITASAFDARNVTAIQFDNYEF